MKRTALKRKTPMRRRPAKRKPRAGPHQFVAAVHGMRCAIWQHGVTWFSPWSSVQPVDMQVRLSFPCYGPVEADHMGDWSDGRGVGRKPDDTTCVPLCKLHHRARHAHSGVFASANKAEVQEWRREMIKRTRALVEGAQEGCF